MIDGYLRVASVAPEMMVADVEGNVSNIMRHIGVLNEKGVEIAVFPELCLTGYTCGDLFQNAALLQAASAGLERIAAETRGLDIDVIVGVPLRGDGALYNCAAFISDGHIRIVKKTYLPTYSEFYERRWFAPTDNACLYSESTGTELQFTDGVIDSHGVKIGIEICEDLWVPVPPSCRLALEGAQVIFNLSASNDFVGKHSYLLSLISQQSARCMCGYVYSSAGFGESTTDVVFLPKTIIAESGNILAQNCRFDFMEHPTVIADIDIEAINHNRLHTTTFADCARRMANERTSAPAMRNARQNRRMTADGLLRRVNPHPFVPSDDSVRNERCREVTTIQECALARRLKAVGSNRIVVGVSGGLDSTLALLVAVGTLRRIGADVKEITAVTMPGFGTTDRTYENALTLMRKLGVEIREISIADAVRRHFDDIGHDIAVHDLTYENSQARERTQILMDVANQVGAIVLGTGDLSELALGWATYNGDHMSMYGINASIPKTLVQYLVRYYAEQTPDAQLRATLLDIVETPISPELTPADDQGQIAQKTEDLVGPYELHDFFLYYLLRYGFRPARVLMLAEKAFKGKYDRATILKWIRVFYRRFFTQQFKRSCLPDGPKVGSVCLSPRGDWRMPSDASVALWIKEIDALASEQE